MSQPLPRKADLLAAYDVYDENRDLVSFVHRVKKRYMVGTLQRLADHAESRMRCAAVLALGCVGDSQVGPILGQALQDDERQVRLLAAIACRTVWNRVGNTTQRLRLADTVCLNADCKYREAVDMATALLEELPGFAEAWYQRGAAWFQLGNLTQAIHDFQQALRLNPYQFVAAAAMGDAYLRQGKTTEALNALRLALQLNADSPRVQAQVEELARQIEGD